MKLKGSYTVEATVIISVCLILFGLAVALAYELFKESINYVAQAGENYDAVRMFRLKEAAMDVINAIRD